MRQQFTLMILPSTSRKFPLAGIWLLVIGAPMFSTELTLPTVAHAPSIQTLQLQRAIYLEMEF